MMMVQRQMLSFLLLLLMTFWLPPTNGFASPKHSANKMPSSLLIHNGKTPLSTNRQSALSMMDPTTVLTSTTEVIPNIVAQPMNDFISSSSIWLGQTSESSSSLLSFADQGQNLAGIFFQTSLLPYLLFLYFLSFRGNRTPDLGNYGFQFVLVFVLATIPSGIISKATYGCSLADVDFLHGGAEALLTLANICIVLGFKDAMTTTRQSTKDATLQNGRLVTLISAALFAATCVIAPMMTGMVEAHSPFLFGIGNLSPETIGTMSWVSHADPINSLSIPTWAIHFSSVFEFLFAMQIIWNFAKVTGNESWKGLTWGMLPLHASGVCACTYHFFYNPSTFQFLVTMQAGFTCLGNITCAIAALRIALANGWTLSELNPFSSDTSVEGVSADVAAAMPLQTTTTQGESESNVVVPTTAGGATAAAALQEQEPNWLLAIKLSVLTIVSSYLVKYGELGLDLPLEANPFIALAMVLLIPAITAYVFARQAGEDFPLPLWGSDTNAPSLSMEDIKKFGIAGTVAYVLTELAFWAIAFPVASAALYQTSGHWPDVINDGTDRATVLGFIFAGANVARLLVPLRLGAALALAPWVDENILNRNKDNNKE